MTASRLHGVEVPAAAGRPLVSPTVDARSRSPALALRFGLPGVAVASPSSAGCCSAIRIRLCGGATSGRCGNPWRRPLPSQSVAPSYLDTARRAGPPDCHHQPEPGSSRQCAARRRSALASALASASASASANRTWAGLASGFLATGWVQQTMTPSELSSQYGLMWWLDLDVHGDQISVARERLAR